MQDRIVIVTGASGEVGQTVVHRWLESGARVVAVASSEKSLAELGSDPRLAKLALDLTSESSVAGLVPFVESTFGVPDTLVHLVGGFAMGPIDGDTAVEGWNRMLALNATSAFLAYRAVIPAMRSRGGGWIVGLSSRVAERPGAQLAAYAASKAALGALTTALSEEVKADGIHVNLIATSTVDTPANRRAMGDASASKWVTADEIADATLYLCSPAASAVFGATLEVYGLS